MAKPGEYDFVPVMPIYDGPSTLSVGIFQWVYTKDGKSLKKSKAVYRVKGPAYRWQEIKERARALCDVWNSAGTSLDDMLFKKKKSETI
jgi:hypothetical protein